MDASRPPPAIFARLQIFAYNVLRFNHAGTLALSRYCAAPAGVEGLLKMSCNINNFRLQLNSSDLPGMLVSPVNWDGVGTPLEDHRSCEGFHCNSWGMCATGEPKCV
jgi:hypothetical protein